MNRLSLLLIAAGFVAALQDDARACSPPNPGSPHTVNTSLQETDQTPPTLPAIPPPIVRRFEATGCSGGGCPASGSIAIEAVATDDVTAPNQIGYRFTLASGTLPEGFTLPSYARDPVGTTAFLFWDGDGDLDFTLEVVAIDLAGNESTPQTVRVADDGGACTVAPGRLRRAPLAGVVLAALLVAARRSRRRPS